MMRVAIFSGLICLGALAYGVYLGVTMTRAQEAHLKRLNQQIAAEQARMKVLRADWELLTKPERLQKLATQHLGLTPIAAAQFTQLASLPMRGKAPAPARSLQDVPKRTSPNQR